MWGPPFSPEGTPQLPISPPGRRGPGGVSTERASWGCLAPRGAGRKLGKRVCVPWGASLRRRWLRRRRVFILYLLHRTYFTDMGYKLHLQPAWSASCRGRGWKFPQSPGTAGGAGGDTRTALGDAGRALHGLPHPAALGGPGRVRPPCAAPSPASAGTLEIPALPAFPPCFNYCLYYCHHLPYSFYYYYRCIFLGRNRCGSNFASSPLAGHQDPPGAEPAAPGQPWAVTLSRPLHLRPRERCGAQRGLLVPGGSRGQRCRSSAMGAPGGFAIPHGRVGAVGIPRARLRGPVPRAGKALPGGAAGGAGSERPRGAPAAGLPLFRVPIKYALPPPASAITGGASASAFFKSHRKRVRLAIKRERTIKILKIK